MSELLPCPFCGGEGIIWPFREHPFYLAICKDGCGCQLGDFKTREEAMQAWNTRAEQTCEPKWVLQGKTQIQEFWRCECGNCGEWFGVEERNSFPFKMTIDEVEIPNYCPNCGAKVINNDN